MNMNEAHNKTGGNWQLQKILGSGGFGQVTLWLNPITGQKIAVKRLLESALKDVTVKAKLSERWCKEVEIMKKLNHTNVVATLEIPAELIPIDSLPYLAMEYCSNGDLRQVLNKAENCCGLREAEILNILRDISSGLAYLHSCKIIHRDIKPDNIVLQGNGSNIIYKLIDLGYAKALDQSSLSESFVGTVQYIAPELFMGKAYTSSVDYWSFGLMTHEIVTGYRPFLPDFDPSDWMKQIQNKTRNIICVMENNERGIVFNSKISRKNHLSRCFLEDIEKWLQLALDWNGRTRGRDLENNRLVIFENLTEIICKKIITVFSLPTYELLSYEINYETDISDLRDWLQSDVGIEKGDQLLLLPSGRCLNAKGNLLKYVETGKVNGSDVSLFLYSAYSVRTEVNAVKAPTFASEFGESSNNLLPYRLFKRYCADSVYFLQSQANLYRKLLWGIRVKITNTKQKTSAVEKLYEDLEDEWNQIEYYGYFLSFSLKTDLENYIHLRKTGKLKSSSSVRKWIQNAVDVNSKITKLKNSFNKSKQRQLVLLAKQRCRSLDDNSSNDVDHPTPLDSLVVKGQRLWEHLQEFPKGDSKISLPTSSLTELVNKAVEETSKFLNGDMLKTLFLKLSIADENLEKFVSQLTNVYKTTNVLKRIIENTQTERQKEVWSLIENSKQDEVEIYKKENSEDGNPKAANGFLGLTNDQCCLLSNVCGDKSENFLPEEPEISKMSGCDLSLPPDSTGASFLTDKSGACSLIQANNHLRYRIQEVQRSCNKMVNEITSLNWDFISESDVEKC